MFDDSVETLRRENENIKSKMRDIERINEEEFEILKGKLNEVHAFELEEVRLNNAKYLECLQTEIAKLEGNVRGKNEEIEELLKEKVLARQALDNESNRCQEELIITKHSMGQLEASRAQLIEDYEKKLKEKVVHNEYLDQLVADQIEKNEKEQAILKTVIRQTALELENCKIASEEREQELKGTLSQLESDCKKLTDTLSKEKVENNRVAEDLKAQVEEITVKLTSKL